MRESKIITMSKMSMDMHLILLFIITEKQYQEIIKRAFNEKWIDVFPNEGKRGGAYSGGSYLSRPYILLNYRQVTAESRS